MRAWQEIPLASAGGGSNSFAIGPFGSRMKAENYVTFGVRVVRGSNLGPTRALVGDFVHVTEEFASSLSSCRLRPNDLVFPHRGAIGEVGLVPDDDHYYLMSTSLMKLTSDASVLDPKFLFYFFRSPRGRGELLKNASTVGTPGIATPLSSLRAIKVPAPEIRTQRAIARILGALDDKIELNRRTNETLEAMARALFQSWFVDFDPVRAKMEGRHLEGIDAETARLFASHMVTAELGEQPGDSRVGSLLEIAALLSGGTPSTARSEYWGGELAWASAKDVSQSSGGFLVETERTITSKGLEESATQLIPKFATVVVARGATTGRSVLFGREMAMNQTCYALVSRDECPFFLWLLFRHNVASLVHAAHGSVFDTITTSTFGRAQVVLPSPALARAFERRISSLFEAILSLTRQSGTLAALRDTLLPKLLSGELRVPDAERAVSAAL